MKLKEVFYLLGFRPKPRVYGHKIVAFDLPEDGRVEYAAWLHPSNEERTVDPGIVAELRRFLKPGDVAIDVGAYTGDTTIPMALAVGKSGAVVALEPNRYVFPVLETNARLNPDKTHIIPLEFAATEKDGEYEFEYSDSGFCNGGNHEGIGKWRHAHAFKLAVRGKNLDAYLRERHSDLIPRIRYIKVDAEGYDDGVLRSLSRIIEEVRPFVRAEIFKHLTPERREGLFSFLLSFGYELHRVESHARLTAERIELGDVMKWRHFDVFAIPK